ncbi:MAG: PAS domain S-box protein, partial [Magnetococcales bacterium]|nr:PAS domain S-box protein [Magnetococcales bacterium]
MHSIAELVDLKQIRTLINSLRSLVGLPIGIVSAEGEVLVSSAWHPYCVRSDSGGREGCGHCSDDFFSISKQLSDLPHGESVITVCPNGLHTLRLPIYDDRTVIAGCFLGPFYQEGDQPDRALFTTVADTQGVDPEATLRALEQVPVIGEATLTRIREAGGRVVTMIASLLAAGRRHQQELASQQRTERELRTLNHALESKVDDGNLRLQEFEARFRALSEKGSDIVVIMDEQSVITFASPSVSLYGYTPQQVVGKTAGFFIIRQDQRAVMAALSRARSNPGTEETLAAFRIHARDGRPVHMQGTACYLPDQPGIRGLVFNGHDITERMRIGNRYQRLVESVPAILYEFSTRRGGIFYSPQSATILGLTPEDLLNDPQLWHNAIHPDDRRRVGSVVEDLTQQNPFSVTYRMRHKDGRWIWLHDRSIEFVQGKEETIVLGMARDITAKMTAQRLQESNEKRLNLLLELNRESQSLSVKELCNRALDIGVRVTESEVGYLHMVNVDQNSISLVTWNDKALEFCTAAHETHYPLEQAGIWADCARLKRPVIHNDYQNMSKKKGYPEGHFTVIRHMSVPVLDGKRLTEAQLDQYQKQNLSLDSNNVAYTYWDQIQDSIDLFYKKCSPLMPTAETLKRKQE